MAAYGMRHAPKEQTRKTDGARAIAGVTIDLSHTIGISIRKPGRPNGVRRDKRTDDDARQIKNISSNREAERGWQRRSRWLEQDTMRVHRPCRVFKRVRGEVFPVLDDGLVFEQLQGHG